MFATPPPPHVKRFSSLQLGSPNLQDIFIGGVSFSGTESSHILKNKMATAGISLKIIYIFLMAVSHRWKVESLHR